MIGSIARTLSSKKAINPKDELSLFSSLRLSNGLFKTTFAGRLAGLDRAMIDACRPETKLDRAMDVGVSSGTTTVEWLIAMRAAGFAPKLTATDLFLKVFHLTPWSWYQVLENTAREPVQYVICGVPIRAWRRRRDVISQFWIIITVANLVHLVAKRTRTMDRARDDAAPILLIAPQAANDPDITFEEDDVFAESPIRYHRAFDVVRAANLLTPGVFGVDLVRRGVANLRSRLVGPGSILVIARTDQTGHTDGTIFELTAEGRLEPVRRIGEGSEIEELVASLHTSPLSGFPGT